MKSEQINSQIKKGFSNILLHGNCVELLTGISSGSADFVLTDPPYMVNYSSSDGRTVPNDDNDAWVKPAFREIYRVLRWNRFCVSFYSWNMADKFLAAWREAGFRIAGHLTFIKKYASTERFLRYQHENAYLLAKGNPMKPACTIPDYVVNSALTKVLFRDAEFKRWEKQQQGTTGKAAAKTTTQQGAKA